MSRRLFSTVLSVIRNRFSGVIPVVPSSLSSTLLTRKFHLSAACRGLMEFFDEKDNWNKTEIRVGRAWKKDELRIKSNEDLHKLWYILLKERNMLLSMEHEYQAKQELFPNPERLDKVKESMLNLEDVVRERDRAYWELETGESGERPARMEHNRLGMPFFYKTYEHFLPEEQNMGYIKKRDLGPVHRKEIASFLLYLNEKRWNEKRKQRVRDRNHVMHLLRRFPDTDIDVLKEQYPSVDIDRVRRWKKARGHYIPT